MLTTLHWQHLQRQLWPMLREEVGPLSPTDEQFTQVLSLLPTAQFAPLLESCGWGRPPAERIFLFHAFIAKAVYGLPDTLALYEALRANPTLRQLCGWSQSAALPHYCTFTRAFAEFAHSQLPQRVHEAMVRIHCGPKLVGHLSRDSTAITAPEAAAPKAPPQPKPPRRKPGPRKKGEVAPPAPLTRLQEQAQRALAVNLAELPRQCDIGCKTDSRGYKTWWRGYKLHLDVIDGDIPVSAVLTSASVHDSQVAIPLAQMSAQRVTALYELMDSAYDAADIRAYVAGLGHVPLIVPKRRAGYTPLDPAQQRRLGERNANERVHSRLKEEFGGRTVRVRGAAKVMCHLMMGVLVITALGLWQRVC